jgi:hypothetical protein
MRHPGELEVRVLPVSEGGRPTPGLRPALVLLGGAVALLVVAGIYNNAAAPAPELKHFAEVVPLREGTSASLTSRVEIATGRAVVTSHFILDPQARQMYPIAGGAAAPFVGVDIGEAVADGDDVVWVSHEGGPAVNIYDHSRGTVRTVALPQALLPVNGTLKAGLGAVGWSYARADGTLAVAYLPGGNATIRTYGSAVAENRTLKAILGPDIFYTKSKESADLWIYNQTRSREELLAAAPGVGNTATGVFFVAWVNGTSGRVEYFDAIVRSVLSIAPPSEVTLTWVMANDLTILMGGTRPGFFSLSPRVEFYDFGLGVAHIYDSIGVDFDANPRYAYADRTVVSLVDERQPRPFAPLTAPLLLGAVAMLAAGGLLGLRDSLRTDSDL